MESIVEVESKNAERIRNVVGLSLESDSNVEYLIESDQDKLKINTNTDRIGVLRGCTDTVFRLTMLAKKLY